MTTTPWLRMDIALTPRWTKVCRRKLLFLLKLIDKGRVKVIFAIFPKVPTVDSAGLGVDLLQEAGTSHGNEVGSQE